MRKTIHLINRKLAELCGWLLLALMILITIDIVSREVGKPIYNLTTIAVYVMMAVVYMGMPYCEEYNEHVSVELLEMKLTPKWATILKIAINFLKFITLSFFLYGMSDNLIYSYTSREAVAGITNLETWPSKLAMLIGLLFFVIQTLLNLIDSILRYKEGKYIVKTIEDIATRTPKI